MRIDETIGLPMKRNTEDGLRWLDGEMAGQDFICGDELRYVDCIFYPLVLFISKVSLPLSDDLKNLKAYMQRLSEHDIIGAK
jgi:glutathione S-transferase